MVVNETEAAMLAGVPSLARENASKVAALWMQGGPSDVIITLGENGVVCVSAGIVLIYDAVVVHPIDTTARG